MPVMERAPMVRRVRFGTEDFSSARRKARRRSKMSTVGQMRWSFVRFGSLGSFAISGEDGSVAMGVVGKVMVRWRHCSATFVNVLSCEVERDVVGNSMWSLVKTGGLAVEAQFFTVWDTRRRDASAVLGR